jgi:hypothetical protein
MYGPITGEVVLEGSRNRPSYGNLAARGERELGSVEHQGCPAWIKISLVDAFRYWVTAMLKQGETVMVVGW